MHDVEKAAQFYYEVVGGVFKKLFRRHPPPLEWRPNHAPCARCTTRVRPSVRRSGSRASRQLWSVCASERALPPPFFPRRHDRRGGQAGRPADRRPHGLEVELSAFLRTYTRPSDGGGKLARHGRCIGRDAPFSPAWSIARAHFSAAAE